MSYFGCSSQTESIHDARCINTGNMATADRSSIKKSWNWLLQVTLMWIGWRSLNCCFCVEKQKHVASRKKKNKNLFKAVAFTFKMFLLVFNPFFLCCFLFVLLFILFSQKVTSVFLTFLTQLQSTVGWFILECLYSFSKVNKLSFGLNLCCKSDPGKDCCRTTASRVACVCARANCQGEKGKAAGNEEKSLGVA